MGFYRLCFRKRSTIGQINVEDTTTETENEEQPTLSNIIYIKPQNIAFFYEVFYEACVPKR